MIKDGNTHVFVAGTATMWPTVEQALIKLAGSSDAWYDARRNLAIRDRWSEVLY
jgi:hypothetical protein